jgi:hypothetical protein
LDIEFSHIFGRYLVGIFNARFSALISDLGVTSNLGGGVFQRSSYRARSGVQGN